MSTVLLIPQDCCNSIESGSLGRLLLPAGELPSL